MKYASIIPLSSQYDAMSSGNDDGSDDEGEDNENADNDHFGDSCSCNIQ